MVIKPPEWKFMAIIARNAGLKINIFYPSVKMSDVMWIRSDICPTKMFKIDLPNLKLFFSENCLLDKMIPKNISTGKNALFLKSINILFFSGFSFYGHWRLTGQQGKGRNPFYSTPPLPSAHEHSDFACEMTVTCF